MPSKIYFKTFNEKTGWERGERGFGRGNASANRRPDAARKAMFNAARPA
jgi:hypothetical protein